VRRLAGNGGNHEIGHFVGVRRLEGGAQEGVVRG